MKPTPPRPVAPEAGRGYAELIAALELMTLEPLGPAALTPAELRRIAKAAIGALTAATELWRALEAAMVWLDHGPAGARLAAAVSWGPRARAALRTAERWAWPS